MEKMKVPYGPQDHQRILQTQYTSIDSLVQDLFKTYTFDELTTPLVISAISVKATSLAISQLNTEDHLTVEQHHEMMWEYLALILGDRGPMKLIRYDKMLDVRHARQFEQTIPIPIFQHLQSQAAHLLTLPTLGVSKAQKDLWEKIASGDLPYGYKLEQQPQGVH